MFYMKSYMYENEDRSDDMSNGTRDSDLGGKWIHRVRFQRWNRHQQDSVNYERGRDEDASAYFERLRARYDVLGEMESTKKHLTFYTHTNPFGCPWCELFVVSGLAIRAGAELAGVYEDLLEEVGNTHIEQSPPMTTRTEHQNNRSETAAVQNVFYKKEERLGTGDDSTVESNQTGDAVVGVEDPKD